LKLYIAEKPSLGRAIVAALPRPHHREQGYYRLGSGDVVTWCIGHLLEQAEPDSYDKDFKQWRLEHLPIIPDQWKSVVRKRGREQLKIIKQFLKEASVVVHAGDPDREGQLLVDEVLHHCRNSLPVKRLLINDLNLPAVAKALDSLENNEDFASLSTSALARSRADWLYGINMTRAYTLLGRHAGYDGVLSVGRVQTPVLGLVVSRDEEIENFKSQPYFDVLAKLLSDEGDYFSYAKWLPDEKIAGLSNEVDDQGRVVSEALAQKIADKVMGKPGEVYARNDDAKSQVAPLPFNLSTLQIEAAKRFGYSAKMVLDICQSLYEKHHLITYPRSDCRYLPEDHFDEVNHVLDAVQSVLPRLEEKIKAADSWEKSRAWNNKKVTAHHAIVPTAKHGNADDLSEEEKTLYDLIARFYLVQFYGNYKFVQSAVFFNVEDEQFKVSGKEEVEPGWCAVIRPAESGTEKDKSKSLPAWKTGEKVLCEDASIQSKKTKPPPRYNDATLMAAMTGIARFVDDPEIKKTLRETDGLGTDATRAMIIETLFKRGFLMKGNKTIFSTQVGRDLVRALPQQAAKPDMTAVWESSLAQIAEGQAGYEQFIQRMQSQVRDLITQAKSQKLLHITTADEVLGLEEDHKPHCPACQAILVLRNGKNGAFWGCSRYPECRTTVPNKVKGGDNFPDFVALQGGAKQKRRQAQKVGKLCPECNQPLVKRKGKYGNFAGCSAYPKCEHTEPLLQDDPLGGED